MTLKDIIVAGADSSECQELCAMLSREHFTATPSSALDQMEEILRDRKAVTVLLDLDGLPVDNLFIKQFSKRNPDVRLIAISSRSFHPELREAMSTHISACLRKPLDFDELLYWLRSVHKAEPDQQSKHQQ